MRPPHGDETPPDPVVLPPRGDTDDDNTNDPHRQPDRYEAI